MSEKESSITALCEELEAYCKAHRLPYRPYSVLINQLDEHLVWLKDFRTRWKAEIANTEFVDSSSAKVVNRDI